MQEKKIESIRPGITSSSSHLASMDGNDFLELVWQNGQIVVQKGSPNRTRKNPSGIDPSREDPCIKKRSRLSTSYSLLDFAGHRDPPSDSSHQNFDLPYSKSNSFGKLEKEYCKPCAGGAPAIGGMPNPNSHKQELGCNGGTEKVNFSNFLTPAVSVKSSYQGARGKDGSNKAPDHSHSLLGFQEQTALAAHKAKQAPLVAKSEETVPDHHSEAVGRKSHNQNSSLAAHRDRAKAKPAAESYNEPLVASSSLCSLGASNDPTLRNRKHEDYTDDSTYISDNDEEPEDVIRETRGRDGSRLHKRSRNTEIHNLSERKRRDKINKKMRALKELIPNCNKMDKASMLDDAIDYLKTLKLQLQVMSMGSGLCMPLMMLPAGAHQLMGGGLSLRPGMGIPCSLPPQFPIPQLHMLGFPNQVLPMPMSHPPFIPMPPKPSTQPNLSSHFKTLDATDLNAQLVCAMQASKQGTK